MEMDLHKAKFIACPDYKSKEFERFEELYHSIQREYYQCKVKKNKVAHRRMRQQLLEMFHLCRLLRRQVSEHKNTIPRYEDIIHPSWEGVED